PEVRPGCMVPPTASSRCSSPVPRSSPGVSSVRTDPVGCCGRAGTRPPSPRPHQVTDLPPGGKPTMSSVETSDATRLRAWLDKSELAELLAVLASAVGRGDRERVGLCYAEDSYDDHGVFKGSGREFADYVCV